MAYAKGRLAEAYTGSPSAKITDLGFSYDVAGRPTEVWQSSPNSGAYYTSSLTYSANGAPSGLYVPGLAGEGRVNAVDYGSSPLVYPYSATSYPHGAAYTALGLSGLEFGSGDRDAFTDDANTGRMTQWQSSVGGQTDAGNLGRYPNGELETMQVADNITGSSDSQDCGYTFDALGRVAGMANGPSGSCLWSQSYSFDPFGNLSKTVGSGTSFNVNYNLYNQIASVGSVTGENDSDGDLLNDPTQGATAVNEYDPDGKAKTFENVAVTYDALNRPVEVGGQEFVYAPDGSKIAVMSGQTLTRADIPCPAAPGRCSPPVALTTIVTPTMWAAPARARAPARRWTPLPPMPPSAKKKPAPPPATAASPARRRTSPTASPAPTPTAATTSPHASTRLLPDPASARAGT